MVEERYTDTIDYTPQQINNFILGGALLGAGGGWTACAVFVGNWGAGLVSFVLLLAFLLYREHLTRKG